MRPAESARVVLAVVTVREPLGNPVRPTRLSANGLESRLPEAVLARRPAGAVPVLLVSPRWGAGPCRRSSWDAADAAVPGQMLLDSIWLSWVDGMIPTREARSSHGTD